MAKTIRMPSSEEIDKKYREGASRAPANYKDAVSRTSGVIEASIAAQPLYAARMSDPRVLQRRADKLAQVTDEDWRRKASTTGAERIGKGMLANADKRRKNYENTRTALDGMTLPDKTADAMTNIDQRLKPVVAKMQDAAGKR